jgi:hypothetical protein
MNVLPFICLPPLCFFALRLWVRMRKPKASDYGLTDEEASEIAAIFARLGPALEQHNAQVEKWIDQLQQQRKRGLQ